MGRARIEDFRPTYIAELIPTQFAFATPLVFILGVMGLYALLSAPRRRDAGTRAGQHDVLDHRGLFHLARAACAGRGQLVRAGLSRLRGRGRGRRDPGAMGAARAAHRRFLPPLGCAQRRRAVRAADRAGQHRHALGLSSRRHRAQRRRRLAGARRRDRGGTGARRREAACWRRTTAPPAGSRSISPRAPASPSRASASAGSTCPSRSPAQLSGKLLYVHELEQADAGVGARQLSPISKRVAEARRMRGPLVDRDLRARAAGRREGRGPSIARRRRNCMELPAADCRIAPVPVRLPGARQSRTRFRP